MAGQIKDWVYKKVDWAYSTGAWEWTVNVATTAELFKLFSSTVIFKDHANVYDNKHYGLVSKYDGLMIRPITGSNGYTGVMHFHLYNENDRYYSDLEGLYGEFTLRDLVLMVFKACGLHVSEAKRTYWLNQVLSLMITLPAERSWVCNTSIRRAGGYQVAAYVDKSIVDDIIDCMRVKGMFEFTRVQIDEIEEGVSYNFEPETDLEESIDLVWNDFYSLPSVVNYRENAPGGYQIAFDNLKTTYTPSVLLEKVNDILEANNITLPDDVLCNIEQGIYVNSMYRLELRFKLYFYTFNDDTFTAPNSHERVDVSTIAPANQTWNGTRIESDWSASNFDLYGLITLTYYAAAAGSYGITVHEESYSHISSPDYINDYYYYNNSYLTSGYMGDVVYTNFAYSEVGPEGITIIDGAVKPKSTTSSSNYWPTWAGRAITVNGYSGSNHPSYTYIPVGYGDYDYEEFTQARVQSGWIFNNTWLQRLGLTMELMDEYEPVEPDPDDPEPIQPDPDPTPEPTPPDPGILDISASRLFTVHQLSNAEVDNLGSFIYSQTFIDAIKNMFMEPMDAIIGCFILNYGSGGTLPLGANETLKLGSVLGATGVTGTKVTNQTFECSFGTKEIGEFYHNVLDYAPYTSIQIYLPYIGFVDLDTNEVMNSRVTLKYRFDVFTGMCLARLFVNRNGVTHELYNFEGNSAVHIPLTGRDFTNAIAPMLSGAVGLIGGAATGNPVAMAVGAKNMIGNTANVKRSGSLSSNTGVLGQQTPFILVNRPKAYNAAGYNNYYGYPSNWTVTLGSCSGYTRCKDVHLDALSCSDQEREEIEALLREGVIF